jgi:putative nucleotidyltransferase-like protein
VLFYSTLMPGPGPAHESSVDIARSWATAAYRSFAGNPGPLPDAPLPAPLLTRLGLGPLLYRALLAEDDERADRFLAEYRHATTANLLRMAHARRLRDRLEAAGIPGVLLKGAAVLVRFGGDPGLRPMADVDLLVADGDMARAITILRAAGLVERSRYPRSGARSHAISLVGVAGPLELDVDLHRGLAPWPVATGLTRAVLTRHDRVDGWRLAQPVDAISATAVHRAGQGFTGSCLELVDLRRLTGLLDDEGWRALGRTSARLGALGAVYASLRQAAWWLGPDTAGAAAGLAELGRRLRPARRTVLHWLAPADAPARPRPLLTGPLGRSLLVLPCATGQGAQALVAAARLLPFRVVDEWQRHRRESSSAARAAGRLLAQVAVGADPGMPATPTSPGGPLLR